MKVFLKYKQNAFTLAEVLITLAIIGVVAALTIPTVVSNYRKTQTVTQLKKAYAALANAVNLAILDNGPIASWEIGPHNSGQAALDFSNKYLIPYLKVSKNCELIATGDCVFYFSFLNSNTVESLNGSWARFYLNDGTLLGISIGNESTRKYANVRIDINGPKKPNKYGKDVFLFRYEVDNSSNPEIVGKFMPADYFLTREQVRDNGTYGCNKNANGSYCSNLIVYDGWQIKDDYPWN